MTISKLKENIDVFSQALGSDVPSEQVASMWSEIKPEVEKVCDEIEGEQPYLPGMEEWLRENQ